MAKKLKCNSCGATYPDTRNSGSVAYFHACPDQIVDSPEVTDAQHNVVTPATFKPVGNPRNENPKPNPEQDGKFVMVSEGNGVTEV